MTEIQERRALGLGPNDSLCPACAAGDHEDYSWVAGGFACSCCCHSGGKIDDAAAQPYLSICDSDDEGAFPIYRHPKAEAR